MTAQANVSGDRRKVAPFGIALSFDRTHIAAMQNEATLTRGVKEFALGPKEFVGMMASLMAMNALAIDAMLPALGFISRDYGLSDPNARQWIVSAYLIGTGLGAVFYGPLSDRFGRRPVLLGAVGVYTMLSVLSIFSGTFGTLVGLRLAQGLAAGAFSVLVGSIVRDRYSGDAMAQLMSFVFIVFMGVPVIAPTLGSAVLAFAGWHMIFVLLALMGAGVGFWVYKRLPETLNPDNVIPIKASSIIEVWSKVITHRQALGYMFGSGIAFGALFGFINSAQQIFFEVFGAADIFPYAFAGVAGAMALASFFNSRIVMRFGARRVSHSALIAFIALSAIHLVVAQGGESLAAFLILHALTMSMCGFIGANFSSIAMEPFGHMAGAASSFQNSCRMLCAAGLGVVIGQSFDGTVIPLVTGFLLCGSAALMLLIWSEKGKLFTRPRHTRQVQL